MKKKLLITGGNGYLGKNLAIKLKNKYKILISSRNNKLNRIVSDEVGCDFAPMDVSDIESVRDVVSKFKPEIIIHAAATKFVDLSEIHPFECIDINILGSVNIARVAIENNVKKVVGVSTDKSASPIGNLYGLSKASMERLFCSLNSKKTKFSCVRFGNITWSTGSVFPIWRQMSKKNGLIKTTGYEMRRFFFSVHEATSLVITCLENINITQGKVLSRKMKAAKIGDILEIWCSIYKTKWKKIKKRKGDKIEEFLIGENEINSTKEINIKSKKYFLLNFYENYKDNIKNSYSTLNSQVLNRKEILTLIKNNDEEKN